MSAYNAGVLVGVLIALLILLGLLVGGILLIVSSRKDARLARRYDADPNRHGGRPKAGTGKLVGGIVMVVIAALGILGQLASAVTRTGVQ